MRVAIEALGAEFGGVRIYLENLLKAWAVQYPDDELLVVVRGDSDLDTGRHHRQEMAVPAPDPVFRPLVQTRQLPRLIREFDAEVSLSTIPVTGLMRTDHPQAVVIHDLRHEIRREEFTRARRVLRAVAYTRAYTVADGFVAVSRRSLDDLHRLHPRTVRKPAAVVHHGADHVVAWGEPTRDGPAIAFGHHTNKRPDLVIRAWAKTSRAGPELPPLRVLGVSAQLRPTLEGLVDVLNLRDLSLIHI